MVCEWRQYVETALTVLLTVLSALCIPLALFLAHSQPVICAIYFCLVSVPVCFMTVGIAALNNILSCTYPAYPLPGNVSCHYTFENWPVLDKKGFSAFMLLHDSFECMEPFASNIHFEELFPINGKSPGKSSAHGPLMTQLLEALGNGFFIIFSGGW